MKASQRLTLKRVQQSHMEFAFLCTRCSWYAVANPVLWAISAEWVKVTLTCSLSCLVLFESKDMSLSDFSLSLLCGHSGSPVSQGWDSVTRFLTHRRTKTVIAAVDHNPLDLTKREEGRKDGWMERKQKKIPLKLSYLLDPQEKRGSFVQLLKPETRILP